MKRTRLVAMGVAFLIAGGVGGGGVREARAAFNEIIAGARPLGMGGAFVAVADDSNALVWNPAGITQIPSAEISFMHSREFNLTAGPALDLDIFSFVNWPMDAGSFGITAWREGASSILTENVASLSYARDLDRQTSVGVNAKILNMSPSGTQVSAGDPAIASQNTISFDTGLLYSMTPFWRLGLTVRNLGGKIGVVEQEYLRTTYRMGSAYRFDDVFLEDDSVTWAMDIFTKEDINDTAGTKIQASTGFEYTVDERVSFRAGLDKGQLTFGIGFGHPEAGIFVDYAYENNTVGSTQRLSATYRFGSMPGEVHVIHHIRHQHPPPDSRAGGSRPSDGGNSQSSAAQRMSRAGDGAAVGDDAGAASSSRTQLARRRGGNDFDEEISEFMNK